MIIADHILHLTQAIEETIQQGHREPSSLTLIAVSKGQPISAIREAYALGIRHFGENYWQEAQTKIAALKDLAITWHFIGNIQSNKAKAISNQVDWVHSVDKEQTLRLLAKYRSSNQPLNICLQVNLDEENTKSGVSPEAILPLAQKALTFPTLKLRGLMAIPKAHKEESAQRVSFLRLKQLLIALNQQLPQSLDTLSMGMSDDFKAAIAAGSTMLRIGRAIFGDRS